MGVKWAEASLKLLQAVINSVTKLHLNLNKQITDSLSWEKKKYLCSYRILFIFIYITQVNF